MPSAKARLVMLDTDLRFVERALRRIAFGGRPADVDVYEQPVTHLFTHRSDAEHGNRKVLRQHRDGDDARGADDAVRMDDGTLRDHASVGLKIWRRSLQRD